MAWRLHFLVAVPLVAIGCQRLEEAEDDDNPTTAPPTSGEAGTFDPDSTFGEAEEDDGDPTFDCDPVNQTGCAEGEKCTVVLSGGDVVYTCVGDSGGLQPLEPCTPSASGIDMCPAGTSCIADATGAGICVALCLANSDCEVGLCFEDPADGIPYCADECTPFGSSCQAPLQCRRAEDRFLCKFPSENDVGVIGDSCQQAEDAGCGPGFVCLPGALIPGCQEQNCCTNVCDLSGGDPCAVPATCSELLLAPAPGFELIGACFVPA